MPAVHRLRRLRHPLAIGLLYLTILRLPAHASNIITDGTIGPAQRLNGPDFIIPQDLGARHGNNLFHSFQRFSIDREQSATFTGSPDIQNVISRVTGGETSHIHGRLRSQIGQAEFYFINPAGVVFGPEAVVDVPAGFHVSTATSLEFADGNSFNALHPERSTLTQAPPEAFGFMDAQPVAIHIDGSELVLKAGQQATLSAGDIAIRGSTEQQAVVRTPGGSLRLEAVGGPAEVPVAAPSVTPGTGTLTLERALIDTSGEGGGAIALRAGSATLTDSALAADNLGAKDAAGGIDLSLTDALHLRNTRVQSNAFADGPSGGVRVDAGALTIEQAGATTLTGLLSEVEPGASGAAGGIAVAVRDLLTMRGAVGIASATFGAGSGGAVHVRANRLEFDGEGTLVPYRNTVYVGGIASEVGPGAHGRAGTVAVEIADRLVIGNSGVISSSTQGEGSAGGVMVSAGTLMLDGPLVWIASSVYPGAGPAANGGELSVAVGDVLSLAGGAAIVSETESQGAAGTVRVHAGEARLIAPLTRISTSSYLEQDGSPRNGSAGDLRVEVRGSLELLSGASISSSTFGRGAAGRVAIAAGALTIDGGTVTGPFTGIRSQNFLGPDGSAVGGPAGDIVIEVAGPLRMVNHALIGGSTFSAAPAGTIRIQADRIDLQPGALIASDTHGAGPGGTVTVRAGNLSMSGNADWLARISASALRGASGTAGHIDIDIVDQLVLNTGALITSDTQGQGNAGDVGVRANVLHVLNGSWISSNTSGQGDAGDVTIEAGAARLDGQGANFFTGIFSTAEPDSTGHAGSVTLRIPGLLEVLDGAQISSSTWGQGDAGDVTIEAGSTRLDRQDANLFTGIFSVAEHGSTGHAGTVNLRIANLLEILNGAQISSSTWGQGDAGDVTIEVGAAKLDGQGARHFTGIFSDAAPEAIGDAGSVKLRITNLLEVLNGAAIFSGTRAAGNAGAVIIEVGAARLDGQGSEGFTGISSQAARGSTGHADRVKLRITNLLEVLNGAQISSGTHGEGNAGAVTIEAGAARLDGQGSEGFTGIASGAASGSTGHAGSVTLRIANLLEVLNGAVISSDTWSQGNGGNIDVHAGAVEVLSRSKIASETWAVGNAGTVRVRAGAARVDGQGAKDFTGIFSSTRPGSTGHAGEVALEIDRSLEIRNAGWISSGTWGTGNAGLVSVRAKEIIVDGSGHDGFTGIDSLADWRSTGQVGNLDIRASHIDLRHGGRISIEAEQTLPDPDTARPDSRIAIHADRLHLTGGMITTASTSNVPAADIHINGGILYLTDGRITTSAEDIATSGGNIHLSPIYLILDGGFIQANAAAQGARGGRIAIDNIQTKGLLIPATAQLEVGGTNREQFTPGSGRNVIQAAAPQGNPGEIPNVPIRLDLASALAPTQNAEMISIRLAEDYCRLLGTPWASTLIPLSRGGLPEQPGHTLLLHLSREQLNELLQCE